MTLEERVALLEDRAAVTDALYRYVHAVDNGPWEEFRDCFTEDAYLEWPPPLSPYEGEAGLRDAFELAGPRPPKRVRKHTVLFPRIALAGDTAHVFSYYTTLDDVEGFGPRMITMGTYEDDLVRGADGVWRFARRVTVRQSEEDPARPS